MRVVRVMPILIAVLASSCGESGDGGSVGATCASTCERAAALGCPGETYADAAECTTQCEDQIAGCDDPNVVRSYLDCVQTTTMECGETTQTASSPECVAQGLAYFACLQGVDLTDVGGTDAGNDANVSDGSTETPNIPAIPAAELGEIAVTIVRDGQSHEIRCSAADSAEFGLSADSYAPAGMDPFWAVTAGCQSTAGRNDENVRLVDFVLTIGSIDEGTYPIVPEAPGAMSEKVDMEIRESGEGFTFDSNAVTSMSHAATLTIVENGGSGGTFRATLEGTWNQGLAITGNMTEGTPDGIPAAFAAQWAFTLP